MRITEAQLREALVEPGHITERDFAEAVASSSKRGLQVSDFLIDKALISEDNMGRIIADVLDVTMVDLNNEVIDDKAFFKLPESVARLQKMVVLTENDDTVVVAMREPYNMEARAIIEKRFGKRVRPRYVINSQFKDALGRYHRDINVEIAGMVEQFADPTIDDETKDTLTVRLVDLMLQYGYQSKASDIHIEPYESKILLRYRIDGVLHDYLDLPKNLSDSIITRLKILARLRTDEHQAAQDGKLRFMSVDGFVDVRVSVVPVTRGEKVVMRILAAQNRAYTLTELGLGDHDLQRVRKAIDRPHGMILVTGPTGSGKTTTLYAMIKILNRREVNITTIEDPVEYDIEGVNQIQVNTRTNLTFAKGLRSIVRQDPDIIMIGEIRDAETADIGINAALTGHLVLSTLHTNDAATTLPRLLDMDMEPFLVASTVHVAIAQRLVRKICYSCRISYKPKKNSEEYDKMVGLLKKHMANHKKVQTKDVTLFKGKGCPICNNTGYIGRVGIFEVLEMSDTIREMIVERKTSDVIKAQAIKEGMTTMFEDGVQKVLNGVTTLEEVLKVTIE